MRLIRQTCGVPQVTKVGPVVFLAMVNNAAELKPNRSKCDVASNDHILINSAKCSDLVFS